MVYLALLRGINVRGRVPSRWRASRPRSRRSASPGDPDDPNVRTLHPGRVTGPLVGGDLCLTLRGGATNGGMSDLPGAHARTFAAGCRLNRERSLIGASGIVGPLLLICYFSIPLFVSALRDVLYKANPSTQQVVDAGSRYHDLLFFGSWLQATGAMLSVVFFLGLTHRARIAGSFPALIVLIGSAVLVAVVLAEASFTFSWAIAASNGEQSSARTSFDLMASFIHVFPIVPAPAVYLPLGIALLRDPALPRAFPGLAIALGTGFVVAGFAGVFATGASAAVAALSLAQSVWILAAAGNMLLRARE